MEHHEKHSPSSFPMKSRCPVYESGPAGDAANRGTAMHDALAQMLGAQPTLNLFDLKDDDIEEVEWAYKHIQDSVSKTWPLEVETKLSYHDARMREIYFGHGDAVNGPNLYDLKTGEQHVYWHQMAAYALALMNERAYKSVEIHLLFSRFRKVKSYTITKEQAEPAILDIIARSEDPNAKPSPNEYCGWCKKQSICPAVKDRVNAISIYNDWQLESYNPDEITKDSNELAKAIHLSKLMKKWVDAINSVTKEHESIPGFDWKDISGRKSLTSVSSVFLLIGKAISDKGGNMELDKFLDCSTLSIGALEKFVKKSLDISAKEAKEIVASTCKDFIKQSESYKKLMEVN